MKVFVLLSDPDSRRIVGIFRRIEDLSDHVEEHGLGTEFTEEHEIIDIGEAESILTRTPIASYPIAPPSSETKP